MQQYDEPGLVNIGTGEDLEIKELALLIKKIVGYERRHSSRPEQTGRHAPQTDGCHQTAPIWAGRLPSASKKASGRVYADFSRTRQALNLSKPNWTKSWFAISNNVCGPFSGKK
jgi:hypothetical protein